MLKNTFVLVLLGTILLVVIGMLLPGQPREEAVNLPWQIDITETGDSRVFGVTLGSSTLEDARKRFREEPEISMFSRDQGEQVVEAYFNSITLSGLKAKMVLAIDVEPAVLRQMFDRGSRIATLGSGARKITLSDADRALVMQSPVVAITYLPRVNLDAELISRRFGEPAEKLRKAETGTEHWLYPDKGLDIALSAEEKEVLQYVRPVDFQQLVAPLK